MWRYRAYAAHEHLVAPARATAQLWRLIAGLILIAVMVLALNLGLGRALASSDTALGREVLAGSGGTPASLLVLLASFGFVTLAVATILRLVHRRSALGVLGPFGAAARDFWRVLRGLLVLGAVLWVLPPWGIGPPLGANLAPGIWLMLLPLSLLGLLIQTSAEEILFRGYIQQQLAARFSNPLVWMIVPSILFAAGHYLPVQAGGNAVAIAVWAGVFGILMADLTARAGNLGPAIAVHFANNLSSLLIVSLPDTLNGLSLYTVDYAMNDTDAFLQWMPVEFATLGISWLVARLAIRR